MENGSTKQLSQIKSYLGGEIKITKYASTTRSPTRHLLPHVLQIMPSNPRYDQFQSRWHHSESNPQSITKMAGNPKFDLFH